MVDDERAVREVVAAALRRAGYQVTSAASAEDALAIQERQSFDLLVTDVMLPKMNGADLAREVRRRAPNIRVLFMSGYTGDTALPPEEVGPNGFLQKPFSADVVVARVRQLLDPQRP